MRWQRWPAGAALAVAVCVTANASDARVPDAAEDDLLMRERVVKRLARSPGLRGSEIEVQVRQSTARLSGGVLDEVARGRAVALARQTSGIEQVDAAQLELQPERVRENWAQVADDVLSRRIAEALGADVFAEARVEKGWPFGWTLDGNGWQFEVDVDQGVATLQGSVPRRAHIAEAIERARRVSGVGAVYSDLFVSFDPDRFPYPYYPPSLGARR